MLTIGLHIMSSTYILRPDPWHQVQVTRCELPSRCSVRWPQPWHHVQRT